MFRVLNGKSNLQIYLEDVLLIDHSRERPSVFLGKGNEAFDMYHGNFEIVDELEERIALRDWRVKENLNEDVIVVFGRDSNTIEVTLSFLDGRMKMGVKSNNSFANRLWIRIKAEPDEHIYGCGEQFSELDLRGKKVPLWVSEQGVGRNKKELLTFFADKFERAGGDWYTTYYPQPTFVSTRRFFCHMNDSHYMKFDFSHHDYHELECWAIPDSIIFGTGKTLLEVLERQSAYLGRQPQLPEWSMDGVILGLQGGTDIVMPKVEEALERGLKIAAIWIQDWEGKRITSFGKQLMWNWEYDRTMYPELPALIEKLKNRGIRVMGYVNPFLAIEGNLYKEAAEKGYLVLKSDGSEYHVVITTFPAAIIDITNPEAYVWLKGIIKNNMIGIGLSGWMADFGEYLPTDAVLYSGEDARSFHNRFPPVWARLNREAVEETGKLGEIFFFTRAGYTGTTAYSTLMWAGDQMVDWSVDDGLPSVIPAALSLGYSGFGLSHSDIGGYTTIKSIMGNVTRSKELFIRWSSLSAFTPVMRTHEGNRPDDNWQFDSDDETLLHFAKMSRVHQKLKPYLKQLISENSERGIPVMRHPLLHYEDDHNFHNMKYQYMLGPDLMVVPVIEEGKRTQEVYLPEDGWIDLWSGREYGPGRYVVDAPLWTIPVFHRKNSGYAGLFKELANVGGNDA